LCSDVAERLFLVLGSDSAPANCAQSTTYEGSYDEYPKVLEGLAASDDQAKQACLDNGVKIVDFEDSAKLSELCEPLYEEYAAKDPDVAALIEYVEGLK